MLLTLSFTTLSSSALLVYAQIPAEISATNIIRRQQKNWRKKKIVGWISFNIIIWHEQVKIHFYLQVQEEVATHGLFHSTLKTQQWKEEFPKPEVSILQ